MFRHRLATYLLFAITIFPFMGSTVWGQESPESTQRVWTDRTGTHQTQAELKGIGQYSVLLKKTNGNTIEVPLQMLSVADIAYVNQLRKPSSSNSLPVEMSLNSESLEAATKAQFASTRNQLKSKLADDLPSMANASEPSGIIAQATRANQITLQPPSGKQKLKTLFGRTLVNGHSTIDYLAQKLNVTPQDLVLAVDGERGLDSSKTKSVLADSSESMRFQLVRLLGLIGDQWALEILKSHIVNEESLRVRLEANEAIKSIYQKQQTDSFSESNPASPPSVATQPGLETATSKLAR
ncbi:MAG: SHD1 domain-containing protein [Planctomycetota bacterium]